MRILAIDPSSSVTGYAIFDGDRLIDAGRIIGKRDAYCLNRIAEMASEIQRLIDYQGPDEVVIEMTSGKVGRTHGGAGAGLAIHGVAVGAIWMACEAASEVAVVSLRVVTVEENIWTHGGSKQSRHELCKRLFPTRYDPKKDSGMDVSDAIMLGRWWTGARFAFDGVRFIHTTRKTRVRRKAVSA